MKAILRKWYWQFTEKLRHWIRVLIKKKLENDIVSDKQSNNVVIPEATIHHVENVESKLNVEENTVELEKEITEKGKDQFTKEKER